ncbi:IS256 family transposase [Mesomycoplasma ovipneumoniae]|uniref:IS256 family transposase n=1 Tax=Mesomycoplasma ovipneumoniae TaxID=29562 RepID=UPI003080EB87
MKKKQKQLSPLELGIEKFAKKYVDNKKLKKEDSRNKISIIFETFIEELPKVQSNQHLDYEKSSQSKNLGHIEEQVISLFASGLPYQNIANAIKIIYEKEVSIAWISSVIDKVLPEIEKWKSQKIENFYPILYIDGMFFDVKENGVFVKKSVYVILAIDWQGYKKALGFWIKNSESANNWLDVFSELKARGLEDVLIIPCDNLSGISQAIKAVFPQTDFQKCVVQQVRNSLLKVSYKDKKDFASDMRSIYQAINQESAMQNLDEFAKKWGQKYPSIIKSWHEYFAELTTFFKYPNELRQSIYTTNPIKSVIKLIKQNTETNGEIQSVDSLSKITYLTLQNVSKKWQKQVGNWDIIKKQLEITFPNRLNNVKLN